MWAARLLAGLTRQDHITLVLAFVPRDFFRIDFKLLLISFNGSAVSYISELLAPYAPYAPVCASRSFLCYRCLDETNTEQTGHEAVGRTCWTKVRLAESATSKSGLKTYVQVKDFYDVIRVFNGVWPVTFTTSALLLWYHTVLKLQGCAKLWTLTEQWTM